MVVVGKGGEYCTTTITLLIIGIIVHYNCSEILLSINIFGLFRKIYCNNSLLWIRYSTIAIYCSPPLVIGNRSVLCTIHVLRSSVRSCLFVVCRYFIVKSIENNPWWCCSVAAQSPHNTMHILNIVGISDGMRCTVWYSVQCTVYGVRSSSQSRVFPLTNMAES